MKSVFYFLLIICVTFISTFSYSQIQIGDQIQGEFEGDYAGFSVSLSADGNRVAIGAPEGNNWENRINEARVYEWNGTNWSKLGDDILGMEDGDFFGSSVSLSGDGTRVAIGAPSNSENGEAAGQTRVFEFDGNTWQQLGNAINGEAQHHFEGHTLSLSQDGYTVAIGSEVLTGGSPGHARIFKWINNNWVQAGDKIVGENQGDLLGHDISLSADGNKVAISSIYNNDNGNNAGHVRVFEWNNNSWIQIGLDIDGNLYESFGRSVSLSSDGNIVAVGLPGKMVNGSDVGGVRTFELINDNWEQLGDDINGPRIDESFGGDIAISADGRKLAVGTLDGCSLGDDGALGSVQVFEWNEGNWVKAGDLIHGDSPDDLAGFCAISADGNRLAIGAYKADGGFSNAGQVRIYENFIVTNFEIKKNAISFFPNPSNGIINISNEYTGTITIFDIYGREIQQVKIESQVIDIQSLPSGIYILSYSSEQNLYTTQIVKL